MCVCVAYLTCEPVKGAYLIDEKSSANETLSICAKRCAKETYSPYLIYAYVTYLTSEPAKEGYSIYAKSRAQGTYSHFPI